MPSCKRPLGVVHWRNSALEGRRRGEKVEEAAAASGDRRWKHPWVAEANVEGASDGASAWRSQIWRLLKSRANHRCPARGSGRNKYTTHDAIFLHALNQDYCARDYRADAGAPISAPRTQKSGFSSARLTQRACWRCSKHTAQVT